MGNQKWGHILPPSYWSRGTAWHSAKITEKHGQNGRHRSSIKVV